MALVSALRFGGILEVFFSGVAFRFFATIAFCFALSANLPPRTGKKCEGVFHNLTKSRAIAVPAVVKDTVMGVFVGFCSEKSLFSLNQGDLSCEDVLVFYTSRQIF